MEVREIMSSNVVTVGPTATLEEAARRMKQWNVGMLPVSDDGSRALGVITDRDIATRGMMEGRDPKTTKIQDVMTANVIGCGEAQPIEDAVQILEQAQIRRLVVMDDGGRICGIVSLGDIAQRADKEMAGAVLAEHANAEKVSV
ncbi:MAG: Hypoxic response protein 1 [Nitrospira sp.]|nr:Hypoxic response protein 1 [Nitrospira sp.]